MISDILENEFEEIKKALISKHLELKMKASGKWVSGLNVEVKSNNNTYIAIITGEKYTEQLVYGRKPSSKFPPIKEILKWIKNKRIKSKIKDSSLAFIIARKIKEEGTTYYRKGGTDLVSAIITEKKIKDIINKIGNFETEKILKILGNEFLKIK